MIKQISLIALVVVVVGIGALSLGTPVFATEAGCTGNPDVNTGAQGNPPICVSCYLRT